MTGIQSEARLTSPPSVPPDRKQAEFRPADAQGTAHLRLVFVDVDLAVDGLSPLVASVQAAFRSAAARLKTTACWSLPPDIAYSAHYRAAGERHFVAVSFRSSGISLARHSAAFSFLSQAS
jgi:hypothetical protein